MILNTIFIISTNRSDYGLLQILMKKFSDIKKYNLLVIRLLNKYESFLENKLNLNWDELIISYSASSFDVKSSLCGLLEIENSFKDCILKYNPKLFIVLGDRYELLPIISQALVANIKIAHISGGEITLGVIDDKVRNIVSFASELHLVAHKEASDRLELLLGKNQSSKIHIVGEPGLEEIGNTNLKSINELSEIYKLDLHEKFILCTLHPETNNKNFYQDALIFFYNLLILVSKYPVLISYCKHDPMV